MDERSAQVGWTDAQWNRVREEVLQAWQRVRVAGSFLPAYGRLPASTQLIPSEVLSRDGTIDERSTASLLEIALPVRLTRQQVLEEDLSSALLQFRRRASQVGQLEDWYVFNGTYPSGGFPVDTAYRVGAWPGTPPMPYRPSSSYLDDLPSGTPEVLRGAPTPIADQETQVRGLRLHNPGALGLIEGASPGPDGIGRSAKRPTGAPLDNQGLLSTVVDAMNVLEERGHVGPFVCVFGRAPYTAAHRPIGTSLAFPRDRLEPLLGRELLHASAIDILPHPIPGYEFPTEKAWQSRGVLLSSAGGAIDLAIAVEANPEFRQVDVHGSYVFSVVERFSLRIKDPTAIVPLRFAEEPSRRSSAGARARPPRLPRPAGTRRLRLRTPPGPDAGSP